MFIWDNKITNYEEAVSKFTSRFKDIKFKITEYVVQNIERETLGGVNNMTIEELCKSLTTNNNSILVSKHSIKSEY